MKQVGAKLLPAAVGCKQQELPPNGLRRSALPAPDLHHSEPEDVASESFSASSSSSSSSLRTQVSKRVQVLSTLDVTSPNSTRAAQLLDIL